jgi:leucyl-tRNA synthetase
VSPLQALDRVKFGKRPTIYSVTDGQACADHDRSTGEGVGPQEYTLIKLQMVSPYPDHIAAVLGGYDRVFFVAATLRPETMYGQTNCFLLPEGMYGAFEMADGSVFICSERSMINMSYQDVFTTGFGKYKKLGEFSGQQLLGVAIKAPNAVYPVVYTLPLLTISMSKGTGVVTSVPSDAPDDYAALRDLQKKPLVRWQSL